jgi:hypothetical protein
LRVEERKVFLSIYHHRPSSVARFRFLRYAAGTFRGRPGPRRFGTVGSAAGTGSPFGLTLRRFKLSKRVGQLSIVSKIRFLLF